MSTFLQKYTSFIAAVFIVATFFSAKVAFAVGPSVPAAAVTTCPTGQTADALGQCFPTSQIITTGSGSITADGTVLPGGDCSTDANCQDVNGQNYGCYLGKCTINGVAPANTAANNAILENPLQAPDLATLLVEILGYVTKIGTLFLIVMLMFVGFQFVAAQGDAENIKKARNSLLYTAIGGLLLLGAEAIAIVISTTVQGL